MAGDRASPGVTGSESCADPASTVELIERARAGDHSALDLLFERHFPLLRHWASGRLPRWARDVADTDDLVQDALLHTFKRLDAFEARGTGALYAYLRQAVLNRVRDELRRRARRPDAEALGGQEMDAGLSPLEQAIGRENLDRYERALASLRPEEQDTLIARLELGCTYEEIAQSLGKPSAEAARKAAGRALVRLVAAMDTLPSA